MAEVTLKRGDKEHKYSVEHAENILNHPIQEKVEKGMKFTLPKDSDYERKDGKLVKKKKK